MSPKICVVKRHSRQKLSMYFVVSYFSFLMKKVPTSIICLNSHEDRSSSAQMKIRHFAIFFSNFTTCFSHLSKIIACKNLDFLPVSCFQQVQVMCAICITKVAHIPWT